MGLLQRYNRDMPGRLFLISGTDQVAQATRRDAGGLPHLTARRNIAPGQDILVLSRSGCGLMRWGMIPVGRVNARGRPVMETIVNARSETVFDKSAFSGTGRGIVLADGWYEWTGKRGRKQPWRIRLRDGALLGFAAITDSWEAPDGRVLPQVAIVTCPPNADVAAVHDRMGVLLEPDDWPRWLQGPETEAQALLHTPEPGRLVVEPADDVDWSGA